MRDTSHNGNGHEHQGYGATFDGAGPNPDIRTKPPFDQRFVFEMADSITEPILDASFAIEGLLPSEKLHTFYGAPRSGKTFGVADALLHVSAGIPYNGRATERSLVIYIAAEGGRLFKNRIYAAMKRLKLKPGDAAFVIIQAAPSLGFNDKDAKELIKAVKFQLKLYPQWQHLPMIRVVDTLSKTLAGAKEDEVGIGTYYANCELMHREFGGLDAKVHHCGKDASKGPRGSSTIDGNDDGRWRFERDANGKRSIVAEKVRDGEDMIGWTFELEKVHLGQNKNGNPVTTCVVNLTSEPKPVDEEETERATRKSTSRTPPRSNVAFDDAFNEAALKSGERFFPGGDGPLVSAVDLKSVRAEFNKRYAVALKDVEGETPQQKKQRRDDALYEAFKRVAKKLPRHYGTETRKGIEYIWRL
jgi:hypothetical protein